MSAVIPFEVRAYFPFDDEWRESDRRATAAAGLKTQHTGTELKSGYRYLAWNLPDFAGALAMRHRLASAGFRTNILEL